MTTINAVANVLQWLAVVLKQELINSCNNNYLVTTIATVIHDDYNSQKSLVFVNLL